MYSDLLQYPSIKNRYLVYIKPRIQIKSSDFISDGTSGSYSLYHVVNFDYGIPVSYNLFEKVTYLELQETVQASDQTLSDGFFYYNKLTKTLYFKHHTTNFVLSETVFYLEYALNIASEPLYYNLDPSNLNTEETYYEGALLEYPKLSQDLSEYQTGFVQIASNAIRISNFDHWLNKKIYYSSFNDAPVLIYHLLGEDIDPLNTKIIYKGNTSDIQWSQNEIIITVFNPFYKLNQEFRYSPLVSFYNTTDFPNLDPQAVGKPTPVYYGKVYGVVPVNIDYDDFFGTTPTSTKNRIWSVGVYGGSANEDTRSFLAGSTTTVLNCSSVAGIHEGDTIWIDKATDEYKRVLSVDRNTNQITLETALVSGVPTASDTFRIGGVTKIDLFVDGIAYQPLFRRDYQMVSFIGSELKLNGFIFDTNMETNLGIPRKILPSDRIVCRVLGGLSVFQLNGTPIGTVNSETNTFTNPVTIIADIIKRAGFSDDDFDIPAFDALADTNDIEISFAVPRTSTEAYRPSIDILEDIFKSSLYRVYLNSDFKWTISRVEDLAFNPSTDLEITDDDISKINYFFSYKDLASDFVIKWGFGEVSTETFQNLQFYTSYKDLEANKVHQVLKTKTFDTLIYDEPSATRFALRVAAIFGDRIGRIEIDVKEKFFASLIGDTVRLTRPKLPGFNYDETDHSLDTVILSVSNKGGNVSLVLDDQKGVSSHSGDF